MPRVPARIASLEQRGEIRLIGLEVEAPFTFSAGQYVHVVHSDGRRIPFSIATSPHRLPRLELHFRPLAGHPDAVAVQELLERAGQLVIEGPHGDVRLEAASAEPVTIIAGGTGASQAHALLDFLATQPQSAPVDVLWSVARGADRYLENRLRAFATLPWCSFLLAADAPDGRNGALDALASGETKLRASGPVFLCGPPGFVYALTDFLLERGVARDRLRSDVFAYAPR